MSMRSVKRVVIGIFKKKERKVTGRVTVFRKCNEQGHSKRIRRDRERCRQREQMDGGLRLIINK